MLHILRADLYRALRFKLFYVLLAANVCAALYGIFNIYNFHVNIDSGYGAYNVFLQGFGASVAFVGILCAIAVSLFVGHDFGSGGVRRRTMAGCTRAGSYISKLIVNGCMCLVIYLSYHLVNTAVGGLLMGWGNADLSDILLRFAAGICMTLAYAAIFTAVSLFTKNSVAALLTCLGLVAAAYVATYLLYIELIGIYVADPSDLSNVVFVPSEWPEWMQRFGWLVIDGTPTGQALVLQQDAGSYCRFDHMLYALGWVALSAVVGPFIFRREELK